MSSQLMIIYTGEAATCGSTSFRWSYNGSEGPLTFIVTNVGVSQERAIARGLDASPSVLTTRADPEPVVVVIGADIDSNQAKFLWEPVAVESGWYIIKASIPDQAVYADSARFFVSASTDTTCLSQITPPLPTSSTATTTSNTASLTSSQTASITRSATISPSVSAAPVSEESSSKLSLGAIIGIALGAVALVAFWLLVWWFFVRRNQRKVSSIGRGGGKKYGHRSALASVDSSSGLMGKPGRSPYGKRHQSTNSIPMSPSEDAVGLEKGSITGYRTAFPDGPVSTPMSTPMPLAQTGRKYSAASSMTLDVSNDYSSRRPSHAGSVFGRQSVESITYPPTSPQGAGQGGAFYVPTPGVLTRSHSLSTSATHHAYGGAVAPSTTSHSAFLNQPSTPSSTAPPSSQYSPQEATSPTSPTSPADSADGTGTRNHSRRQSVTNRKRKPVPVYEPGADELAPSPVGVPTGSAPPSPSPSPVPPPAQVPLHTPHYATRNRSQPELTHKSSFGPGGLENKKMHYLMPDMPPPSKG